MGFFKDIKSLFKGDSLGPYDPAGRYLAIVIQAVANQDSNFLSVLLGIKKETKWICNKEYFFHGGKRRADLAVYEEGLAVPTYLVEIKVRDNKDNDHTRGQFKHYRQWAGIGNRPKVFVISPYGLAQEQMDAIDASKKALKLIDLSRVELKNQSEFAMQFALYLKEEGYTMKPIEESRASAFTHFLIAAFLPHHHGLGGEAKAKAERVADGPLVFADIVSNFQLLAQTFPSRPKRPTVQYIFHQGLKASRVDRKDGGSAEYIFKVEECDEDAGNFYPSRDIKIGGTLYIFAYCPLGDSGRLEIGISIQIERDAKKHSQKSVQYGLYAEVSMRNGYVATVETAVDPSVEMFPGWISSQSEANREFSKLAKKLNAKVRKDWPDMVALIQNRLPSEWVK
jgi:hypothetical protein